MEWLTQLSDVLATRWAELVAIFGLSGIGIIFAKFIVKLILNKVEANIKRKYNGEVYTRITDLESKVDARMTRVEDTFKEELAKQKQEEVVAKQELYKQITATEVAKIEIDTEISTVTGEKVEPNEVIEEVKEVAQNENIEVKPTHKVAKRVINE